MKSRWLALSCWFAVSIAALAPAQAGRRRAVPRVTVISVLPETHQALLWDGNRGEYVVVRAGDLVQGRAVRAIDGDGVVLVEPGDDGQAEREIVLPFDADLARRRGASAATGPDTSGPADPYGDAASGPADPYGSYDDPARNEPVPADPYAELDRFHEGDVKTVLAPDHLRAGAPPLPAVSAAAVTTAPVTSPAPGVPVTAAAPAVAPASAGSRITSVPAAIVQPQATPSRREESYTVRRADLDAALADFSALAAQLETTIDGQGVHLTRVATGSLAQQLGLRVGDRIVSVDGAAIHSLDDAALVYVRLLDAKRIAVEVARGTAAVTLRYTIR